MNKWRVAFLLLLYSGLAFGQREIDENRKPSFKDRMYLGGGIGLNGGTNSYGNRYFYVGLYPILGYMVTNQFSVGTSLSWQHYEYPDVNQSYDQYGFSPFVRYNLGQAFLYSEYMILNSPSYDPNAARQIYNRWLMGVGYQMPLGNRGRGRLNAMALYDVIYKTTDRVFPSPWVFRVFFSF